MKNKKTKPTSFNSERTFSRNMNKILINLILPKLKDMIEYSIDTHDCQGIEKLLKILDEFHY